MRGKKREDDTPSKGIAYQVSQKHERACHIWGEASRLVISQRVGHVCGGKQLPVSDG